MPLFLNSEEEMIAKTQFQSTEALAIRLRPFIDKTTGEFIVGGSDTVTLEIRRPNGTALPGGPHEATYDANVDMWTFDIATGSYVQGEWRVKAESDDADALPQWASYRWGDYVEDIATIKSDVAISRKVDTYEWKIEDNQLLLMEPDGTTIFKAFNLFDALGDPTSTRVFRRVPVP